MKQKIKHVCFDLDGTLVDSFQTIFKATEKTLRYLKIDNPLIEAEFSKRIGHHFTDIFSDLKIPLNDFEEFINLYKKYYFDFMDRSHLYPFTEEILSYLNNEGIKISLLTTKAQDQAEKILAHFKLIDYFSFVMGRRENVKIKPDAEPLLIICKELNSSIEESLIIGDTELDINCGKNAGVKTCAASYGYRDKRELKNLNPDYIIENLSEIKSFIMKQY